MTLGISVRLEYINEAIDVVGAPKAEPQIGILEIIQLAFACLIEHIIMAYVQFFLPLLHWTDKDISAST